jgi:DNA-nicking Smr family endonuclease
VVKKRDLGEDERTLWDEVTRHVRRLKARKPEASPRTSAAGKTRREPTAASSPLPVSQALPAKPVRRASTGFGLDGATAERLRRGKIEPDARLDLHGLTQAQAHTRLSAFVRRGHDRGERCLLVITGKGTPAQHAADDLRPFVTPERPKAGVLRTLVPRWLQEDDMRSFVVGVQAAHQRHGGAGALYVYLRRRRGG